jgi:hypothetical protein
VSERPHHAEHSSQAAEAERRAWVRYPSAQESVCQPYTQDKGELCWPAQIRDISTGGVKLLMTRRFEPGTVLSVELTAGAESLVRLPVARVRRVRAGQGGGWVIGCQFLTQLSDEELEELRSHGTVEGKSLRAFESH